MNIIEKRLLENVFDSLDRLFDKECKVIDFYALIFASDIALKETKSSVRLSEYIDKLDTILKAGGSENKQRECTISATNSLRDKLNELLPID
jgi:hypothetical protein